MFPKSIYSSIIVRGRAFRVGLITIFAVAGLLTNAGWLHAATLSSVSLTLSDPRPSATGTTYSLSASNETLTTIKCIKETYADTAGGSNVPVGLVTTGAGLDTTNTTYMPTPTSWVLNKATNGSLLLTNAAGETPASASARKLVYTGITNGSTADTRYFLRLATYNNTDCATSPIDSVVVAFVYTNGSTLSLSVDPTLTFSVNAVAAGQNCNGATSTASSTATTIPFGSVSPAANSVVCQDLVGSTNATSGYTIYTRYLSKPSNSLGQTIADWTGTNAAPTAFPGAGTEAYGYTTSDTTLGTGTPGRFTGGNWAAEAATNAEVGYEPAGISSTTYRVGHQVGVSTTTRPGTYVTTIIYSITPTY